MDDEEGTTEPAPFSVMFTLVAVPPNVLPLTVTGMELQVMPVLLLSVTVGGLIQPHETANKGPIVVQPAVFLTAIIWLPLSTPVKIGLVW